MIPESVRHDPGAAVRCLFPTANLQHVGCPDQGAILRTGAVCDDAKLSSPRTVLGTVMHLNDSHGWTRTQIADWLDTIGEFPLSATAKQAEAACWIDRHTYNLLQALSEVISLVRWSVNISATDDGLVEVRLTREGESKSFWIDPSVPYENFVRRNAIRTTTSTPWPTSQIS